MHVAFFFFFLEKKLSTRHAYQWSDGFEVLDMLPRGPMDLRFGHASQRSNGFEIWTCFLEVRWFDFGRASQRFNGLNLDMLPRGPLKLNLDVLPRGPMDRRLDVLPRGPMDWNLGRASQRSKD